MVDVQHLKRDRLEGWLEEHKKELLTQGLREIALAFMRSENLMVSPQWVAAVADDMKLKRRRRRGPDPQSVATKKQSTRARQAKWLSEDRKSVV